MNSYWHVIDLYPAQPPMSIDIIRTIKRPGSIQYLRLKNCLGGIKDLDSSRTEIDCVDLKRIEWEINDENFVQTKPEQMICVIDRNTWEQYRMTIFCIFDEPDNTNVHINQCMVSTVRGDPAYMDSRIVASLQIIDDAHKKYDLELRFAFQSQNEIHEMKSVTEKFLCEVSNG